MVPGTCFVCPAWLTHGRKPGGPPSCGLCNNKGDHEKDFLAGGGGGVARSTEIAGERIRAHVKFLASDLLEGRGVGVRGGDLATEYLAAQFTLVGAKPAGDAGTYFQSLTLVGRSGLSGE